MLWNIHKRFDLTALLVYIYNTVKKRQLLFVGIYKIRRLLLTTVSYCDTIATSSERQVNDMKIYANLNENICHSLFAS